ncbi:MAG: hypothetical protein AAF798_14200 [Bacteroidota bacterium]
MRIKILIVVLLQVVLQLAVTCCRHLQFYDYSRMKITAIDEQVAIDEELTIELTPTDFHFTGMRLSPLGTSSLLASCDKGWNGMKFPFTNIVVNSDSDFDATHLTGTSMNDYFQFRYFAEGSTAGFDFITIEELLAQEPDGIEIDLIVLLLKERPSLEQVHRFKIVLTKSNGEVIELETEPITWLQ